MRLSISTLIVGLLFGILLTDYVNKYACDKNGHTLFLPWGKYACHKVNKEADYQKTN